MVRSILVALAVVVAGANVGRGAIIDVTGDITITGDHHADQFELHAGDYTVRVVEPALVLQIQQSEFGAGLVWPTIEVGGGDVNIDRIEVGKGCGPYLQTGGRVRDLSSFCSDFRVTGGRIDLGVLSGDPGERFVIDGGDWGELSASPRATILDGATIDTLISGSQTSISGGQIGLVRTSGNLTVDGPTAVIGEIRVQRTGSPVDIRAGDIEAISGHPNAAIFLHGEGTVAGDVAAGTFEDGQAVSIRLVPFSSWPIPLVRWVNDSHFTGDTDDDGDVDIDDLNNVRNNFGEFGGRGDATLDGEVDLADLNAVRNNFGLSQPVPEPSALALLLVGVAFMRPRRRAP